MPPGSVSSFLILLVLKALAVQILSAQQGVPAPFTLNVNAKLVFLDITVLDRHNRPVTQGLTKDDFTIIEEHQTLAASSFEAPEIYAGAFPRHVDAKGPMTEIVLDRLNSLSTDFSYLETSLHRYLASQPAELEFPVELMLLDNTSFEMLHAYTRNRDELLETLDQLSPALPQKLAGPFFPERLLQSISALREIALRNEGLPGRKNVIWLGFGAGFKLGAETANYERLKWFSHDTTNALVDGRISLFVIYPGQRTHDFDFLNLSDTHDAKGANQDDPFSLDIGTGAFAYETGGTVLANSNWPDRSIREAESYGSNYYTLTYRPPDGAPDGRFRRVSVKMRDPKLHAVTKVGYYAPDNKAPYNLRQQEMLHIQSEVRSSIQFDTLGMSLAAIVRHTDTSTVELTIQLAPRKIDWHADDEGKSHADLMLAAVSLDRRREVLTSRFQDLSLHAATQDVKQLAALKTNIHLTLHMPRKTEGIRVVLEGDGRGRIGSLEI